MNFDDVVDFMRLDLFKQQNYDPTQQFRVFAFEMVSFSLLLT